MKFVTKRLNQIERKNIIFLEHSTWDDWFKYATLYYLTYYDNDGTPHELGSVKIGQINMKSNQRSPNLPNEFETLGKDFFSVGQDFSFYKRLSNFGDDFREEVLSSLKDIAYDADLYKNVVSENVTKVSLFRDVTPFSVKGQYRRLANGEAELSPYSFSYKAPRTKSASLEPIELLFSVEPNSNPPTNVHVIIGRNGVGKTYMINNMIMSLLGPKYSSKFGKFTSESGSEVFSNIVSVTFSAFDTTEPLAERRDKVRGLKYSYIGLKREKQGKETSLPPKSPTILKNEFVRSVETCRRGSKNERWKKALSQLESDSIFREAEVAKIAEITDNDEFKLKAAELFNRLSSGHKIVLLTITRLVETVEERSLVLIDEPEAHLHPPLLSAYIRVLSMLLIQRNAVALIATHSPVVLQEIPKSCVWKLRRSGADSKIERLEKESFAENVGLLTREVFGLEVTESGYHKLLKEKVKELKDYKNVLEFFNSEVGFEGRALINTLVHNEIHE